MTEMASGLNKKSGIEGKKLFERSKAKLGGGEQMPGCPT